MPMTPYRKQNQYMVSSCLLSLYRYPISSDPAYFVPIKAQGGRSAPKNFVFFQSYLVPKKRDHPFKVIGGCIRHVSYSYVSDSSSIRMIRLSSAAIDQPFG